MKSDPSRAKILIAGDRAADTTQIIGQLADEFESLRASTDPLRVTQDFDDYLPDVLVLAFDTLANAQRYYLGLYRLGRSVHQHTHRTVVLCNKDEVRAAFELCKQAYYDDYVLYWPHSHDGKRLAMSIWIACREMMALRLVAPVTRAPSSAALTSQVTAASVAGELARPLILCVDDEEFARQLVEGALDGRRYELLFAASGGQALAQLKRVRPDIILVDMKMPGLDGVAFIQRLKALPHLASIPVIMLTGDARRETLTRSLQAGAAAFVVKPFTREALNAKLEKILQG